MEFHGPYNWQLLYSSKTFQADFLDRSFAEKKRGSFFSEKMIARIYLFFEQWMVKYISKRFTRTKYPYIYIRGVEACVNKRLGSAWSC